MFEPIISSDHTGDHDIAATIYVHVYQSGSQLVSKWLLQSIEISSIEYQTKILAQTAYTFIGTQAVHV